jgi:hypothetical protein
LFPPAEVLTKGFVKFAERRAADITWKGEHFGSQASVPNSSIISDSEGADANACASEGFGTLELRS